MKRPGKGILIAAVIVLLAAIFLGIQITTYYDVTDPPRCGFANFLAVRLVILFKVGPADRNVRVLGMALEDNGRIRVRTGGTRGTQRGGGKIFYLREKGLWWEIVEEYEWE
jgi:hypothetical protein